MITQTQYLGDCKDNLIGDGDNQQCLVPPHIDFRIKDVSYNEYTFDLLIKQNPDVIKKVKIKSGIKLSDLSHLNPVLYIISDKLPIKISEDAHIVRKEGNEYYYYTWSNKFNRYFSFKLEEGYEFYDLKTQTKYRLVNGELLNCSSVDLSIEYSEASITINSSQGKGVTINSATHSKAGLLSKSDKIKLDNITSYQKSSELVLDSDSPNVYIKFIYYNPNTQEQTEELFLIPEVTESKNGLATPELKKVLESLSSFDFVSEIKPDFSSTTDGLTYFYITKNSSNLATQTSHKITIPLVNKNSNGLMSIKDKNIIDKFKFVYLNNKVTEVYYDGALLTNEKFKVSRDASNYYIEGNDGTKIILEPYDPETGKAGLLTEEILNSVNTFTSNKEIVEDFRGFRKGEKFTKITYQELFNKLLFPDIKPTITLLQSDPDGGVFEKESTVKLTLIEVEVVKKSYDISKIEILDDKYNIVYTFDNLEIKDGGIFNINVPYNLDTTNNSEMFFIVRVTDIKNNVDEVISKTFRFIYPFYYGVLNIDEELDFNTLNKIINIKSNQTITYTSNYQKLVFGYPEFYGELDKIFDVNGLLINGIFTKENKTLTTSNTRVPYIFYISDPTNSDNIDITFKY